MPKTIRNVYEKETSFENLLKSHKKKARRGKREKKSVILFEIKLEEELLKLEQQLKIVHIKQENIMNLKYMSQKKE